MHTARNLKDRVQRTLRTFHADQSGAIALAVMAALLITLMMSLVLFDTTPAARQKLQVQTAADSAAWSQSAVEARSMNMIAFANVNKRLLMGQANFYASLKAAHLFILGVTIAAYIVAKALEATGFGAIAAAALAKLLKIDITNLTYTIANEATDIASFYNEIIPRLQEDMTAVDNYQSYFQQYTPWWSFGEAWRRGLRNGAHVAGWPTPGLPDGFREIPTLRGIGPSGVIDSLPIERDDNVKEMCIRSRSEDLAMHIADYGINTLATCSACLKKPKPGGLVTFDMRAALTLIGGVAAGIYAADCNDKMFSDQTAQAWRLIDPSSFSNNEAEWFRRTSNLVFAYQPGKKLNGRGADGYRGKYGFLGKEGSTARGAVYGPDGYFGMARSEISFQNGDPDMWHASWTARMRPVALPGEWAAYSGDYRMVSAYIDVVPYLALSAGAGAFASDMIAGGLGDASPIDVGRDLTKGAIAFEAITNTVADGVAR